MILKGFLDRFIAVFNVFLSLGGLVFGISRPAAFAITDRGLRRSLNEDACLADTSARCFTVADGVGGAAAGEVASGLFISTVSDTVQFADNRSEEDAVRIIEKTFLKANGAIFTYAAKHPECSGMACTAELLLLHDWGFVLGHVGDSRTYRFRSNRLERLTRDHSFVQQQLDSGKISADEAKNHRYRNVILRAVGADESIDVDIVRGAVQPGDLFLSCTDGLTNMVGESDISDCLRRGEQLAETAKKLVETANENGGRDNITLILVRVPA